MYDITTHLLLAQGEQRERQRQAAEYALASRIVRLRRLDRRAQSAATRARLVRLALQ
jgi:hypothetical protein